MSTGICVYLHYALYLMQLSVACNLIYQRGTRMTTRRWIISHRCCWITVYVSFRNAQLNIIVVNMSYICIVMRSLFINCPTVICSPNTCYWRVTTSVDSWEPRSICHHHCFPVNSTQATIFWCHCFCVTATVALILLLLSHHVCY